MRKVACLVLPVHEQVPVVLWHAGYCMALSARRVGEDRKSASYCSRRAWPMVERPRRVSHATCPQPRRSSGPTCKGRIFPARGLILESEPFLPVDVYVADEQASDPAPHQFYVYLDREGRGFHLFAPDLPSLLQLLSIVGPNWLLGSCVRTERRYREDARAEESDEQLPSGDAT
jgi:hypothetical protein